MTELLEKAFRFASKLPAEEQDFLARMVLDQLASEAAWADERRESARLKALAEEALEEHRSGKTQSLDPDAM